MLVPRRVFARRVFLTNQTPNSKMSIIQAGAQAPDFELESHDDRKIKLSDLRGKKVLLVFYPLDFTPT